MGMRILLHLPVNHRLRPLYRFLAGLTGLYVLVFGIVGAVVSRGHGVFSRDHIYALGLRTNLAFAVLSLVVGVVVLIGVVVDHNLDHILNLFGGLVFMVAGMFMLGLLQTDLNLLNYTVSTCVVSFVIGLVLFTAGLYSRVGSAEEDATEERRRTTTPGLPSAERTRQAQATARGAAPAG
jgi:hypothetical protein